MLFDHCSAAGDWGGTSGYFFYLACSVRIVRCSSVRGRLSARPKLYLLHTRTVRCVGVGSCHNYAQILFDSVVGRSYNDHPGGSGGVGVCLPVYRWLYPNIIAAAGSGKAASYSTVTATANEHSAAAGGCFRCCPGRSVMLQPRWD